MITVTDLFAGAGGSAVGAVAVPGVALVLAANHSALAMATHSANFPDVEHDVADISQVDPRRYRRTSVLWASPECTNHSKAQGRRRAAQQDLFTAADPVAERSRATMWDVPRFAEHHRYDAVIVENVVDAADWEMWPAWLHAMTCLGYRYRLVMLNSMHAPALATPRAPQSRDRLYVVFWRTGLPEPDLDPRPISWCAPCGHPVAAVQWWKRPERRRVGRYGRAGQYLYRCPGCHQVVEPAALPAAAAIDWALPGRRIGDRAQPLRPATLCRIQAGLDRYAHPASPTPPLLVPAGGTRNDDARPVSGPFRTRTTRETEGLLVPVEARDGTRAQPTEAPMRTQTARHETALVVPYYGNGHARPTGWPMPTMTTVDTAGLAFIAELRGGGSHTRPVTDPLATVCAHGNHHMLVRDTSNQDGPTPIPDPTRTLSTAHQPPASQTARPPAIEDCTFRMLAVHEIAAAMAFTPGYILTGTQRQRVMQLGNAVTPPAAEWLIRAVVHALSGTTPASGTGQDAP